MKKLVFLALVALTFTTGFTCSKNQPAEEAAPAAETAPAMEEAAPAGDSAPAMEESAPAGDAAAGESAPAEGNN